MAASESPLVIGMEGPAGLFSADQENVGFRVALAEANAAGGIHGRKLADRGYPRPDRAAAAANARDAGYEFCAAVELGGRQPADVDRDLAKLAASAPDTVFIALHPEEAKAVMASKARLGLRFTVVATGPLSDEKYLDVPGGSADGTLGFCHFLDPERASGPGFDAYRAVMHQHAPAEGLNRYSVYGYVYGLLVLEGLRRAGPAPTREAFVDAMESIRDWDSGGIVPPVSFSAADHHAQHAGIICELRGGHFEPLTGWVS